MIYIYFAAYSWVVPGGRWGVGQTEITVNEPITTVEQIIDAQNRLAEHDSDGSRALITNFQLLRMESEAPTPPPPTWPTYTNGGELPV